MTVLALAPPIFFKDGIGNIRGALTLHTTNSYFWLDMNWKCLPIAVIYFRYAANFYL